MGELFTGVPPPAPGRHKNVIRVTSAETAEFICLSSAIYGQPIHWFGRRSHECSGERGQCQRCKDGWPLKWKGYLHVAQLLPPWNGFLELTAVACQLLVAQAHADQDLRGMRFRIAKTKGGPKGRYLVSVLERRELAESLPQAIDPLPTLRFLWNARKHVEPVA